MLNFILQSVYKDESGFVVTTELVLVTSIAVIGLIGGLTALSSGITSEISSFTNRLQELRNSTPIEAQQETEELEYSNCTSVYTQVEG